MFFLLKRFSKSILVLTLASAVTFGVVAPVSQVSAAKMVNGYSYTDEQVKVLDDINTIRGKMGLNPVALDIDLTKAAEGHSMYLFANDEITHVQTKTLYATQGHSWERIEAQIGGPFYGGRKGWTSVAEIIAYRSPKYAVEDLMSLPFHRSAIINPITTHVGSGTNGFHNTVIDTAEISSSDTKDYATSPLLYPYNGQTGVPISQKLTEEPNPFEGTGLNQFKSGYILSATTVANTRKSDLRVTLKDSTGKDVPFIVRAQNLSDTDSPFWAVIPKQILKPLSKYTFTVNNSTSTFTTGSQSDYDNEITGGDPEYIPYKKLMSGEKPQTPVEEPKTSGVDNKLPAKFENRGNTKDKVGINLDGKYLTLNPAARIKDGVTFVPLRGVLEAMGTEVLWDQEYKMITINKGKTRIVMYVNSEFVDVFKNGVIDKSVVLDKAPYVDNNSTFIPLRFISETLGAKVVWDQKTFTVGIDTEN